MLQVEKIINAGNCELVIKWSDGQRQILKAQFLQLNCPCVNCEDNRPISAYDVKILSFELKGRLGLKVNFSAGCQKGIFSFNKIRSWLKNI